MKSNIQSLIGVIVLITLTLLLSGCQTSQGNKSTYKGSMPYVEGTPTIVLLREIPDLDNQPVITIAVYDFTDQTGQRKPSTKFSQLSTAVTQGADVFVINALKSVSGGDWFQVIERKNLDNLVKERQLIRSTRDLYDGEQEIENILKPLLFAGLIVEGGIVGYDSNTNSGGFGARYFGIGINDAYRVDQVTVAMRLISVQTGEILLTTNVTKTIASHSEGGDVFKFLDMGTKALEVETGVAVNEPTNYAIRTAIEYAVLNIIMDGEKEEFWKFKNELIEIPKENENKVDKNTNNVENQQVEVIEKSIESTDEDHPIHK
jgi:curli production assembly/transport component CsgG|tara:strand:- start:3812 stop:4765 length:954 start_codon:yes stop_codon:yes gene_type:complete